MKSRIFLALVIISIVLIICIYMQGCLKSNGRRANALPSQKTETPSPAYTRSPAVAGAFYEGDPEKLKKMVEEYLEKAELKEVPGTVIGFMEPHAGYAYSVPVAAYGYKRLIGKKYETVIVLAPSHRARFPGVSIIPSGYYKTPLGEAPVDSNMAKKISSSNEDLFNFFQKAHEVEHSLEVQVPFLQLTLKKGWKIVPIVFGQSDFKTCVAVATAIAKVYDPEKTLIIASTDMSHYHPYETAKKMDLPTLKMIEKMDIEGLAKGIDSGNCELCGVGPVITMMVLTSALKGKAKILKYANSGDTAGSKGQVVGYGCVAFYTEKKIEPAGDEKKMSNPVKSDFKVTDEQKKMLMSMARKSLEERIKNGKLPTFDQKSELLDKELGLFVTLRKGKEKQLRGCIGHCFPVKKLRHALPELAESAALNDPRFPPVREGELEDISIEISILSPMEKISDWRKIQIPGYGVYVKKGFRAGVFLPQVAEETGWDRETFMAHLCSGKAGLSADAWKDPETELYIFTVVKFEEDEVK